jgi:hypothetical protein
MRLKARTNFQHEGTAYRTEDLLDVPDGEAVALINRDLAMIWNLEDHKHRSEIVDVPSEPLPDVPPVTISPTSASPGPGASTDSFDVVMTGPGTSGTWTVDKDASATWLTYTPMTAQSTDGTVTFTVTANTGAARTGRFYVNGKTFTVVQAAGAARHGR